MIMKNTKKALKNWEFTLNSAKVDLLPYIDYNRIKETPKLFLSYSDGTYDRKQFVLRLIDGAVQFWIVSGGKMRYNLN